MARPKGRAMTLSGYRVRWRVAAEVSARAGAAGDLHPRASPRPLR